MTSRVPLRIFNGEKFLRELHHFLWTPAQVIGDAVDAGWSCRDHALVVGILLESFGYKTMLAHGEALFVRGPSGKSPSVCFTQRPHHWLLVADVGAVDLSVKPDFASGGEQIRFPLRTLFANQWHPRGKGRVIFINDAKAFARAEQALPQQRNHATAVYLTREAEHTHEGHINYSAGWIGSALTGLLEARYGDPVALYAALMVHLHAWVSGNAPSLAGLSFDESWKRLSGRQQHAVEQARQLFNRA